MEALIRSIGREPQQRDTLYRPVPEDRRAASFVAEELAPIVLTPRCASVAAWLRLCRERATPVRPHPVDRASVTRDPLEGGTSLLCPAIDAGSARLRRMRSS